MPQFLKRLRTNGFVDRGFLLAAACVLTATGIAKMWSATFGPAKYLLASDPVTGIAFGRLLMVVSVIELGIVGICLFANSQKLKLGLIAWLATNFVLYRCALWWIGWQRPCGCMGNLTDALHISPELVDNIMKAILAYLLIGSYGLLIWQWRSSKAKIEGGGLMMAGKGLDTSPSGAVSDS